LPTLSCPFSPSAFTPRPGLNTPKSGNLGAGRPLAEHCYRRQLDGSDSPTHTRTATPRRQLHAAGLHGVSKLGAEDWLAFTASIGHPATQYQGRDHEHHNRHDGRHRASKQAVWDVLTDFAAYGEWNPFLRIEGTAEVGTKLVVHMSGGGEHFFILTTNEDGTTHLEHGERFSGALVALARGDSAKNDTGYEAFSQARQTVAPTSQPVVTTAASQRRLANPGVARCRGHPPSARRSGRSYTEFL
jgi:hypothetical protein